MSDTTSNHSNSQIRNLLDSIGEGIYCVDLQGRCTYCNWRCVELLGYDTQDELLGRNMHELVHYQHRDGSRYEITDCKIFDAYHNDRKIHVDDEVFFRQDGHRFDAEYWSYPIKEEGKVVGAVVSFNDITLRREEAAYRNHLARLVETSHDAIISKNLDGVITSWNQGATEIYGFDAEEAIGQTAEYLLPGDRTIEEPEILNARRDGKELPQFIVQRKRKNGEMCDVSITVSPIYGVDNELIGSSSIERDITENLKSQDAIIRAMTAAENAESMANRANRSRTEFLANVSHELRTPMNAILGMLNLSLEEKLDPVIAEYLSVAKNSAESLLELVNELLDFAKIESGKFEIRNEPFDLREAIDTPAKVLSGRASEKGLEILCEVDGQIPTKLVGDGRRIQQVITNLLSNAVKFTNSGEIFVGVKQIRKLPDEVRLRFSVKDTGIGIAEEDLDQILLPFQQADMSSTRTHHGTGLGLSICRELVSLMGGKLKLTSQIGQGSRFYFELSLKFVDDSMPADQMPTELVEDLKVLIVDDNPTNLRILEKIFVGWSMQPIVSQSAEQALRILKEAKQKKHEISLAIIDALMPKVDGFELAEKLAEESAEPPPIVMMQSAADLGMYAERKAKSEVTHFLTKPVSQSELLNAVVESLDLYSHPSFQINTKQTKGSLREPIQPLSILLVEDLPANQKVAQVLLKKRGHRVTTADNGRVAVELVQSGDCDFDLILMDVQMPVMDGLQATAAIRAMTDTEIAELPIIAMTAHAMQGDRETCLAAGMDAYISKPLDAKHLIDLVESIVLHPPGNNQGSAVRMGQNVGENENPQATTTDAKHHSRNPTSTFEIVEYENSLRRLGGDVGLFIEFTKIFMDDSPQLMQEIKSAVAEFNYEQLEKSAHALKGLMSNFGAKRGCELAAVLENAGRNRNGEGAREMLARLKEQYALLCSELRTF